MEYKLFCLIPTLVALASMTCMVTALNGQCSVKSVLTYNTALLDHRIIPEIPNNRLERREAILSELRRVDADVVCLQEVWIGQDVERVVDGLSDVYRFSHSKIHVHGKFGPILPPQTGPSHPPCSYNEATAFIRCARRNRCHRRRGYKLTECLNRNCYHIYVTLSQECVTCAISSYHRPSATMTNCIGKGLPSFNMRTMNSPGLLILSKTPLYNAKYTDFHPYTTEGIERGYLEADTHGLGKVVCTHVTMNGLHYTEMSLKNTGAFSSYWEQGHSERTELIEKFGHIDNLVLAGDFNTGAHFGPLTNTELPHEYYHLARVFKNMPVTKCTLCWPHENIYTKNTESMLNVVVDHVFYKGHKAINSQRVVTPADAMLGSLPLSDHNGVKTTFLVC